MLGVPGRPASRGNHWLVGLSRLDLTGGRRSRHRRFRRRKQRSFRVVGAADRARLFVFRPSWGIGRWGAARFRVINVSHVCFLYHLAEIIAGGNMVSINKKRVQFSTIPVPCHFKKVTKKSRLNSNTV
jgi:hypothetical protein